jgi:hypothetical protein
MKRAFLFFAGLALLVGIIYFNNNDERNFYGKYTFEKVSYLPYFSSSTVDYEEEKMAGTKYTIEANLFKIESADNTVEINSPYFAREEIPNNVSSLCDVRSFIGNKVQTQYTVYPKGGNKTSWRLYVSKDCLWIASVAKKADGLEIIMYIYKLSENTN